jgi:hypothetical protein
MRTLDRRNGSWYIVPMTSQKLNKFKDRQTNIYRFVGYLTTLHKSLSLFILECDENIILNGEL